MHARPLALAMAHPWLPLARLVAAPASRRYFAGWFAEHEIHVLAPAALERRASAVPGSREALLLTPRHEYSHLVLAANNPDLPPPFSISHFRRYVRWAWLCEGGAAWLAGPDADDARGDRAAPARGRPARVPARAPPTPCCWAARSSRCWSRSAACTWPPPWPRARWSAGPAG